MEAAAPGVTLIHPNRDKAESKATRAAVILLLLASAGLIAIVTFGGWSALQGAQIGAIAYMVIYLISAYFVARWNRGILPVIAALALLFAVIAGVAGPGWFERDKTGFDNPAIEPGLLGLLTLIIVPVQLLMIAFSLRGFTQAWNVEIELGGKQQEGPDEAALERRRLAEERLRIRKELQAKDKPFQQGGGS